MSSPSRSGRNVPMATVWLVVGVAIALVAWMIPIHFKAVTPPLLKAAGQETPSVAHFGRQLLDLEKLGPAEMSLAAARLVGDPGTADLERGIKDVETRRPEWVAWGGWDPFLDPLFNLKENSGRSQSTAVLSFFITEKARQSLRAFLSNSRSLGVQSVLQTREINGTTRFIPATHGGGQTLDAVILLTALLYQGDHFSAPLQRELRRAAETAVNQKQMGDLETFYLDLLSLGKRLDWIQLCELLKVTDSTKTVGEYAHLARLAPENLPLIYTSALFSNSADQVATYLITFGRNGLADLRLAMSYGAGAVQQLLRYQAPIDHSRGLTLNAGAELALLYPRISLAAKYGLFLLGAFVFLRGIEVGLVAPRSADAPLQMKSSVIALLMTALFLLASEPYLLKAIPPSEFRFKVTLPALANLTNVKPPPNAHPPTTMDNTTLLSIGVFATFQVCMYLICLMKIRDIARQALSPLVKLRLMENEENLFDGGLYVGIGGTATALVLQVLGVIQPNLLAAYSSNLFGITCVALVKIRHVRAYKRQLILESQAAPAPLAPFPARLSNPPTPPAAPAASPTA